MNYKCIACSSGNHQACIAKAGSMKCSCSCNPRTAEEQTEDAYLDRAPWIALWDTGDLW